MTSPRTHQPRAQAQLPPGSTIGVVGGGQLGRMLAFAAHQHGYRVAVLTGGDKDTPAGTVAEIEIAAGFDDEVAIERLLAESDVITWEFENVDVGIAACSSECRPGGSSQRQDHRNRPGSPRRKGCVGRSRCCCSRLALCEQRVRACRCGPGTRFSGHCQGCALRLRRAKDRHGSSGPVKSPMFGGAWGLNAWWSSLSWILNGKFR